jgi:prepilin-type N-terminal cleavage/methylation domain-containing protein
MIPLSFIKTADAARQAKGFTLVELVVTIVLVGIIGTFTTFFLYTGFSGYLRAKDTAEGALKAQIALDRISLELRDIKGISAFTANTTIDYTSTSVTLPGNRQITYNSGTRAIALSVDGNANPLLTDVASFTMTATYADLNYYSGGGNEVQAIDVVFTVGEIRRQFSARIFPRNMVPQPP